jgi:hypothetical protein
MVGLVAALAVGEGEPRAVVAAPVVAGAVVAVVMAAVAAAGSAGAPGRGNEGLRRLVRGNLGGRLVHEAS